MTQIDEPNLDDLIDKYRADIMLAAQGINSENEQYKDSSINVAALSTINLKSDLQALISDQVAKARIDERGKCQELVNRLAQLNVDTYRYQREIATLNGVKNK